MSSASPLQICITCPAPARSRYGNRVTALRWGRILRSLGHQVTIGQTYDGSDCDLLLALHARRSADAILRFRRSHPERPIIVALTGTDLYRDIHRSKKAQRTVELATRLVALQPFAARELAPSLREKLRVIYQSVKPTPGCPMPNPHFFDICLAGHLRSVKDPFRAALASRLLPSSSKIRILHAGAAMEDAMAAKARAEEARNPRYKWLGEIPRWKTRRLIASSHLLVLSSRMEGGANVISEAVVDHTPVLASRIPGSIGLLGEDYPGYFPVADTRALTKLMLRAESDSGFYGELKQRCATLAPLFAPERETAAWKELLAEIARHVTLTRRVPTC